MGRLVHFEIHVDDMERAKKFYGSDHDKAKRRDGKLFLNADKIVDYSRLKEGMTFVINTKISNAAVQSNTGKAAILKSVMDMEQVENFSASILNKVENLSLL